MERSFAEPAYALGDDELRKTLGNQRQLVIPANAEKEGRGEKYSFFTECWIKATG